MTTAPQPDHFPQGKWSDARNPNGFAEPANPLGVYIHWPYCARICPYCDFNVFKARPGAEPQALARAIVADLEAQAALTGPRTLTSIFLGGGTPSLMDPAWAAAIIAAARRLWTPAADLEVTLEANPTDAEAGAFQAFAQAGVNRLSLGLQSLDDRALAFLGRNHDARTAVRAAEAARAAFPRLSLDLIYARPDQTPQAWAQELEAALALAPEHLSPYQLTIEAGTAFDRAVRRGQLTPPDPDTAAALFDVTQEVLTRAGFDAYEVSNHALGKAARSRHNLIYWQGHDYVGAGPGAHGRITLGGVRHATHAAAKPADYIARVAETGLGFATREPLNPREAAEERLLSGLRIGEGVALAELTPLAIPAARIADLVELGLIADDPMRLRATAAGRLVLDRLTAELAI
ncbi:MAG: coproporphyrinogen III oxidase [Phenylobacterium sp.]|nr:MAG: coproporphyrinogen III oxidase [Phenylobacterium sp.]